MRRRDKKIEKKKHENIKSIWVTRERRKEKEEKIEKGRKRVILRKKNV